MPAIRINIKAGGASKAVTGSKSQITIGRAADSDLVLPFPFVEEHHLLIENTRKSTRIRTASPAAGAMVQGKRLDQNWVAIPSPGYVEIVGAGDKRLTLEIASIEPRLQAVIVRDGNEASGNFSDVDGDVELASLSREPGSASGGDFENFDAPLPPDRQAPWWANQGVVGGLAGGVWLILIVGALWFNHARAAAEQLRFATDERWVNSKIEDANQQLKNKNYAAAKSSLLDAEPVAKRWPKLEKTHEQIAESLQKPEIVYGAAGYVQLDARWMPEQAANDIKAARQRDETKIVGLEKQMSDAVNESRFDDALSAGEQALAVMRSEAVQPHPRESAMVGRIQDIKNQQLTADMTSKGYALYNGKWVTGEEKIRLEQEAKGLVEVEGQWMTREQAEIAKKNTAAGLVLYQGKWMTPDDKMKAQGLVNFEDKWVTPKERDATLAQRAADEKQAREKAAAESKGRRTAYARSQEFLKQTALLPADATFPAFEDAKTTVVIDQGWYIVQGSVTYTANGARQSRTYLCKLRPKSEGSDAWEAETTAFAN